MQPRRWEKVAAPRSKPQASENAGGQFLPSALAAGEAGVIVGTNQTKFSDDDLLRTPLAVAVFVPEPATGVLVAAALVFLGLRRRRAGWGDLA